MIRYRTEDRSRILPGQCPCGSVLQTAGAGVEPSPEEEISGTNHTQ